MANRYWVGGTASWDGTAGTKWATTSGGAGGAAVPTSADDVFFDANSGAVTCTVSGSRVAQSITCTGFTGTLTNAFGSGLTVSGSVTFVSGMTFSGTGNFIINGTGTLTSGGKTFPNDLVISGTGIIVTLGDALSVTNALSVAAGTFDTSSSNFSVSAGSLISTGVSTRTINLNGSTVTVTGTDSVTISGSNVTLNAGTSQINCSFTGTTSFYGNSLTFYNVAFTGATSASALAITLYTAATFNNLSFTAPTSGLRRINVAADYTVNGTLTCSGASGVRRLWLRSDTLGTTRTLTVATCAPSDCDFRDITIAGAAAPISGTRIGDCGGNSGITFPAAKTVYWNPATSTGFDSVSAWATTSGGTTLSADNFPLAQDTAVVDNASRASIGSNSNAVWNIGTFDSSNRTSAMTLAWGSNGFNIHGNWTNGLGITQSSNVVMVFAGRSTQTITSNGVQFSGGVQTNGVGNTVQLADALSAVAAITLTTGTFDAVSYNVSAATCSITGTGTRTLTMGSGTWTFSGTGTVWNAATTTGLTFNKGTANITLSNTTTTARTFAGGGLTYNKLTIGGTTGTSTLTFTGSNTFSELASTKTVAHTLSFTAGTTTTVGAWTISGTSGNVVTIQSATAASHTLTKTGGGTVSSDYLSISYSTATPSNTWYAGTNSTNGGNNSGWLFTAAPSTISGNFLALF